MSQRSQAAPKLSAPALLSCVALGKSVHFSVPLDICCQMQVWHCPLWILGGV